MEYEQVLLKLAPCGLDCSRCAGYRDGEIARLSRDLLSRLGNYRRIAPIRARTDSEFAGYEQFEKILTLWPEHHVKAAGESIAVVR